MADLNQVGLEAARLALFAKYNEAMAEGKQLGSGSDMADDAVRAYLSALAAGEVTVKPLEWQSNWCPRGKRVRGAGVDGSVEYTIAHYGGDEPKGTTVHRWARKSGPWSVAFETFEAARAAAQADYEARILSALAPKPAKVMFAAGIHAALPASPPPMSRAEDMEEAVARAICEAEPWLDEEGREDYWLRHKHNYLAMARAALGIVQPALADVTDGMVKAAAQEFLSHKGERPWRVTRRGAELWEDYVPAIRAALVKAAAIRRGTP